VARDRDHGNIKSPPNTSQRSSNENSHIILSVGLGCEVQMKIDLIEVSTYYDKAKKDN